MVFLNLFRATKCYRLSCFIFILLPFASAALAASPSIAPFPPASSAPPAPPTSNGQTCTVKALGNKMDDTPQIMQAFQTCNNGGTVVFPSGQNYWIATKLNPVITDVTIEWRGIWTLTDNLTYWRQNSYPITFQNHRAGFVITGKRIHINGYGTGGINGNGNAWYNAEKAVTLEGRPMPFVFWNVSDVNVEHFFVKDSPLWTINIMNGKTMAFNDILANSTAVNAPFGSNWVQNTDGLDCMDCNNVNVTNFVYQGGDDCLAIKPRSYNIFAQNITCNGGNGIAVGSLGQYLEDSSVGNVLFKDARILTHNNDMKGSAHIKTWIGQQAKQTSYESAGLPRGGGWGVVQNIQFQNFYLKGADIGPNINQNYGDNGSFGASSLMTISNIRYINFTGYTTGSSTASIGCSKPNPCSSIVLQDVNLATGASGTAQEAHGTCSNVVKGGITGMTGSGC